jgi:hypothetical protein
LLRLIPGGRLRFPAVFGPAGNFPKETQSQAHCDARSIMRQDQSPWAVRERHRRQLGPNKKAPRFCKRCARSISPRIERRTRPPHPAPHLVTIAKRPSK